MNTEAEKNEMTFGGITGTAVAGTLAGVAIAVGTPWVVLAFGQALGATAQLWLVVACIVIGGLVTLLSAILGLVMPSEMRGKFLQPDAWREFAREARAWEHSHGRGRHFGPPWARGRGFEAEEEEAPARPKRRKG